MHKSAQERLAIRRRWTVILPGAKRRTTSTTVFPIKASATTILDKTKKKKEASFRYSDSVERKLILL